MSEQLETTSFNIRPATKDDALALADLHCRAYRNRFFDRDAMDRDGNSYGASLAQEFPMLEQGQDRDWFSLYWEGFVSKLDDPDPYSRNYCFVAECEQTGALLAFIKGSGLPLSEDAGMSAIFNEAARQCTDFAAPRQCGELGSVYCDPDTKYRGLGTRLTQAFTDAIIGLGYEAMITRAYYKNDSPAFFERLGAEFMGSCPIPNDYLDENGDLATVDIPGVWLYWGKDKLEKLKP